MTDARSFDGRISSWLEEQEAGTHYPAHLLSSAFEQTRDQRQVRPLRWPTRPVAPSWVSLTTAGAAAIALVAAGMFGLTIINGPGPAASPGPIPSPTPSPTPTDLGIFGPAAGRTAIASLDGIWAIDPAGLEPPIRLTTKTGAPLGWSRDGTRLLVKKTDGNLWILHADGSETQLTNALSMENEIRGSGQPLGATISPDGSRVVFAGLINQEATFCHDGALFAVDADGGPAEVFWKSHSPHNGIVKGPTFSPDGSRIAFIDGYCDNGHSVWVANADGSGAHQILTESATLIDTPNDLFGANLGGGHAYGLAWSPTGDRLALAYEGRIFTFAPDGSNVEQVGTGGTTGIFWSPDGAQVETTGPWLRDTPQ